MVDLNKILAGLRVMTEAEELEHKREQAEAEARKAQSERSWALRDSEIPITDEMRAAVVRDTLKATPALATVRQWHEAWKSGAAPVLVLVGRPGVGKGVAAAWVLSRTHRPVYLKARNLVAYHAASFGEERQRYEQAVRTELLVVDEVGTEQREAKAAIQDVLDDRIGGKRRTLLISNLSKAALLERLDERTVDRLRELGVIVELAGKSMRSGAL